MSMKESKKKFLELAGEKLVAFGFGKKAKGHSFYRPFDDGWCAVHFAIIRHHDDFDVTISVSVRFYEVENIVNATEIAKDKSLSKKSSTVGCELGNLACGGQKRWTVSKDDDIYLVVPSMIEMYEQVGEPYLQKYSSLDNVYEALSGDDYDRDVWIHSPLNDYRVMAVITIAKLLNKPNIEELIAAKMKYLDERANIDILRVNRLIERVLGAQ